MLHPRKIRLTLFIVVSALALVLAACGGTTAPTSAPPTSASAAQPTSAASDLATPVPAEQPTSAPAGQATTAPAGQATQAPSASTEACPAAAANQTVTMWSPLTGPDGKFMTTLAERFTAENGMGIKVTHLPQPEYFTKLQAAAAAKNLPEMTVIHLENIPEAAIRGVVQPMSPEVLAVIGDVESEFPKDIWAHGAYKGQRYSIPFDVHPLVLYYNKDMFKAAGVPEPPTDRPMTKEEFETAIEKLNANGVQGISIGTAFQAAAMFQAFIRQFGGAMASEDGTKATFNSDAGVKALQYIADLKKKYSPAPSGAGDPEVKVFQQGKAAMVMHGPWHVSDMLKLGFVGFAPMPQIGDTYAVWGGSHQMALTTTDPAKQLAAACWISWASKNSAGWAEAAGMLPVRNSVRTSPELATKAPAVAGYASEADAVGVWPEVPGIVDALWGQGSGVAIDAVLLGQETDIKKALDDAAAKSDKIIADNATKYQ